MLKYSLITMIIIVLSLSANAQGTELTPESIAMINMFKAFIDDDAFYVRNEFHPYNTSFEEKNAMIERTLDEFAKLNRPISDFCLIEYTKNDKYILNPSTYDPLKRIISVCNNFIHDLDIGMDGVEFNRRGQIISFSTRSVQNSKSLQTWKSLNIINSVNLAEYFSSMNNPNSQLEPGQQPHNTAKYFTYDQNDINYINDNFQTIYIDYTNSEPVRLIISKKYYFHPDTNEKLYNVLFHLSPSGDPYACSGNEWYIINDKNNYPLDAYISYYINSAYYLKDKLPSSYILNGNEEKISSYKKSPLENNQIYMLIDYFKGRPLRYSFGDIIHLKNESLKNYWVIKHRTTKNTNLYQDLRDPSKIITIPSGVNLLFLYTYNYDDMVNYKDMADHCWATAINEVDHYVLGWVMDITAISELNDGSSVSENEKINILNKFPRK